MIRKTCGVVFFMFTFLALKNRFPVKAFEVYEYLKMI